MLGIAQNELIHDLHLVPAEHQAKPALAIPNLEQRLAAGVDQYAPYLSDEGDLIKSYHGLPLACFSDFSFDELCKLKYSSDIMMNSSVRTHFEAASPYCVVEKIRSSMWRWSYRHDVWNEVVEAYQCLRSFSFGLDPDFTFRIDYATSYNERGYSEYTRTFLDGAFGFVVYYKAQHVMTIGFSILAEKRILLQQVQLKQRKGNRFLYRLPKNYLAYIAKRFQEGFSGYTLYLIDGVDQYHEMESAYIHALERADSESYLYIDSKLAHLCTRQAGIEAFYRGSGAISFGATLAPINGIKYHEVLHTNL